MPPFLPFIKVLDRAEAVRYQDTKCHENQWNETWIKATDPGVREVGKGAMKSPYSQLGPHQSLDDGTVCWRQSLYKKEHCLFLIE